jgi:transcription elongation factor GreA
MQLPKRRADKLRNRDDETAIIYLTPQGLKHLESELHDLEHIQQRQAIDDVARTVAMGDLSENAEYQEAKHRLARIHSRIFSIKDRLKRVQVIRKTKSQTVQLGSTVVLQTADGEKIYEIVGPSESNPRLGRISHISPLGAALIGQAPPASIVVQTEQGERSYFLTSIR